MNTVAGQFASRGYRSLGVARADAGGPWRLLGVLPLADPPRKDSAATITAARHLGVTVKMVTGDQVAIAKEIARQVGLGQQILDAAVLTAHDGEAGAAAGSGGEADAALAARVEAADGFAQVFPEHKYRIVAAAAGPRAHRGHDRQRRQRAPALRQADAGIAVSGATDAARAAADVVLMAPGLSVIVDAIRTARETFAHMTSYATYRIAETIRILLLISLAIIGFGFFPVTAAMIVFLAVLNDAAILSIAYDHVQRLSQAAWDMRTTLVIATVLGVIGVAASFLLFALANQVFGLSHDLIRTLIYLKLSVAGQLTIFLTRTRGPFWTRPAPAPLLLGAVATAQLIATLIAVYGVLMTPLGWGRAVWSGPTPWPGSPSDDRVKLAAYRWLDRHPRRATAGAEQPS